MSYFIETKMRMKIHLKKIYYHIFQEFLRRLYMNKLCINLYVNPDLVSEEICLLYHGNLLYI